MKPFLFSSALLMVLAFSWHSQAAELYRWVDSKGVMHYSDTPPPNKEDAITKRLGSNIESDEDLSFEARRAKQNFPVTLYVGSACGDLCDQGRSLLNKRGIPFSEKVLKTKEDVEALKQLSGIEGMPMLAVGKTYRGGFLAEQWHSELDIAGYPKTAPYRAPGKPSSSSAESAVAPANSPAQ